MNTGSRADRGLIVAGLLLIGLLFISIVSVGCKTTGCASGKCGVAAPVSKKANPEMAEISTGVLKRLLVSGAKVALFDARTGKFDDGNRIPGARSLSAQASAAEVEKAVSSKDDLIVTYCSNLKCPASRKLAEHLADLGYNNVLEYPEGIAGWREAGNKVTKAK